MFPSWRRLLEEELRQRIKKSQSIPRPKFSSLIESLFSPAAVVLRSVDDLVSGSGFREVNRKSGVKSLVFGVEKRNA